MDLDALKNSIRVYYPAILLDRVAPRGLRAMAEKIFNLLALAFFLFAVLGGNGPISKMPWPHNAEPLIRFLQTWQPASFGLFCLMFSFAIVSFAFKAFYNSYYFSGVATIMPELGLVAGKNPVSFEAAEVLFDGLTRNDFTGAFILSRLGSRTFFRLGVDGRTLGEFLSSRVHVASFNTFKFSAINGGASIGFGDVAAAILSADAEFFKFLSVHAVTPKDFAGSAAWAERLETIFRSQGRFWGRDSLGRIRGIGKDWAYGGAFALGKFAHDITERGAPSSGDISGERLAERDKLEAALARSGEANVLLVADEGADPLGIVFDLGDQISRGLALPPLEHKRLYLFDQNAFAAFAKDKQKFESELLHILNESARAGNVILVLGDFPAFVESAKSIGTDLVALMDDYLASPDFQVIAIANPGAFHAELESQSKILHRFEKIQVAERGEEATMESLEDRALAEEAKARVFFTFQALEAVSEGAKRYLTEGVVSDKALHLLAEAVPVMQAKKKTIVERADILSLIEAKTGIPAGEVREGERDTLLHLEDILHRRIIGQDEAITAISGSLRRARSDIENPERPMGSFLFLGPTGVGKTETTKALAATFFGKEESIIRLDMSEYQTGDALSRLIGSFEDGKAGVLSSKLREQPYGVLLLDEFEKTSKEVLDLFLQILDEGFFSDMAGKRVNARNLIIIATSNAGSDLIWNMVRAGKNLAAEKDDIVNEIINRGIFKPELLNRFDGVVLFQPLSVENLQKIAGLMLQKLQKRLAEKGITLVINEALTKAVMAAGTDPEFGARPMNRAIQEKVEQVIAKKIIAGDLKPGSRVELSEAELA